MDLLRRRLGGDRAVWLYGLGIGGGGLYYVTQYVSSLAGVLEDSWCMSLHASLERVEETGRLRFIDVNEAQEREVSSALVQPGFYLGSEGIR